MNWRLLEDDCVVALAQLELDAANCVVVTDPVWPNAPEGMFPGVDAYATFAAAAQHFPRLARRAVIHLGCMSDPRLLASVPPSLPFVRACWLRYALPSYMGTVLNSGDVAYVFGSREGPEGKTVLAGEWCSRIVKLRERDVEHPCPRDVEHVSWLVRTFTYADDVVLDPFAGSGTTGVACLRLGRRFIGIEKDAAYAAVARERLEAEAQGLSLREARAGQMPLFGGTP